LHVDATAHFRVGSVVFHAAARSVYILAACVWRTIVIIGHLCINHSIRQRQRIALGFVGVKRSRTGSGTFRTGLSLSFPGIGANTAEKLEGTYLTRGGRRPPSFSYPRPFPVSRYCSTHACRTNCLPHSSFLLPLNSSRRSGEAP